MVFFFYSFVFLATGNISHFLFLFSFSFLLSFWLQATYLSFKCINEVKPGAGNFTDKNQLLSYSSPTVLMLDEGYRTSNIRLKILDE